MGGIPRVQMVFNLDPSSSTIYARFDLPPFTSFEPLALFTILPHYDWCAVFHLYLIFRAFFTSSQN